MQLSNKIKAVLFIVLSYLIRPLFVIITLQIYGIFEARDHDWVADSAHIITILALSYYTYLAFRDKNYQNKLKNLKYLFPALIITAEIILGFFGIQVILLPSIIYITLVFSLFFLKEETDIKIDKTLSILTLGLILSSCGNSFDSPAAKVVIENIRGEYLLQGASIVSFNSIKSGEKYITLDIAKNDSVKINKLLKKYKIESFGIISSSQLLQRDFMKIMFDSLNSMEQREHDHYKKRYEGYSLINYWGMDARLSLQISKDRIEKINNMIDQIPVFVNRYHKLAGLDSKAVGVEDYYVDFTIKTFPAEVELKKYKYYQLYLPSYIIAFQEDIHSEDFPVDE